MTSPGRVEDVLVWLAEVLREHEASSPQHPLLLPSSVSERERWVPLIEQVVKSAEGVLVDAVVCGAGVECGDFAVAAPDLFRMVTSMIEDYNRREPGAQLELKLVAGRAEIIGAQPLDAVNAAQRAFREVMTALCDRRLRESDLVALIYAEDALDRDTVAAVWDGLMSLPDRFSDGVGPSTICVIAGDSSVRAEVHCSGRRSLRFRVEDGRFQVRHPYANSLYPIRDLGRHAKEDMPVVVLFLGAGVSVPDGLPSGDTLRDQALSSLTRMPVDRTTYEAVATGWFEELRSRNELEAYERAAGPVVFAQKLTLERVLEHEQRVEGSPNSLSIRRFASAHAGRFAELESERNAGSLVNDPIARIARTRARVVFVTVNFDRFVEARAGDDVEAFTEMQELDEFPYALDRYLRDGGRMPLLKMHGSIESPSTLVATISETASGLNGSRQRAINHLVATVAKQNVKQWWYLGYSMRDRDLENVWRGADFPSFNEHWVAPFLDPNVKEFIDVHRLARWSSASYSRNYSAQERLVSLTAGDFLSELADVIDNDWA